MCFFSLLFSGGRCVQLLCSLPVGVADVFLRGRGTVNVRYGCFRSGLNCGRVLSSGDERTHTAYVMCWDGVHLGHRRYWGAFIARKFHYYLSRASSRVQRESARGRVVDALVDHGGLRRYAQADVPCLVTAATVIADLPASLCARAAGRCYDGFWCLNLWASYS